jgi:hypothetical protein
MGQVSIPVAEPQNNAMYGRRHRASENDHDRSDVQA